jgi:hypothetical protein
VEIEDDAVTCDMLTNEDLLTIVQSRTDDTNETEEEQVEPDSVDAAMKTVHVSLLHKENVTNEVFAAYYKIN